VPGVALAAVVAAEDERLGEVPIAWVQPNPGNEIDESAVTGYCEENLARYKVPRRIHIVDQLPLTAGGKIHKAALRERTAAMSAALEDA
jgi:acyl-CoA synthetase (AMP-forming)/AMP-acid ligase II